MTISNNVGKFNNQDAVFAAGTAVGAGILTGYVGAKSINYLPQGIPSDTFISEVKRKLIGIIDKKTVEKIAVFEQYGNDINQASDIRGLCEAEMKFNLKLNPNMALSELKKDIKEKLTHSESFKKLVEKNQDLGLDIFSDINHAENFNELTYALVEKDKALYQNYSIYEIKRMKKEALYTKALNSGLDIDNFDDAASRVIYQAYDLQKDKFIFNKNKISQKMYKLVKDTADKMKYTRAAIYGISGAVIAGSITYLITKLVPKNKKVPKK